MKDFAFGKNPRKFTTNNALIPRLQNGAALSFVTQNVYSLTVTAISSAGTQDSTMVLVLVSQVREIYSYWSSLTRLVIA